MAGHRRPESFWRCLVAEWRASGQPLSRFAKGRGVSTNSLAYWVTRPGKPVRMLQVEVEEPIPVAAAARIEVQLHGAVLRLSTDVAAAWLAEVIRRARES